MQSISAVLFAAFQLLFIYTFSVSAQILDSDTNVKVVPIYFKPDLPASQATALIKKGLLEYDTFLNKGIFKSLLSRADDIQGKGCFGVIDAENNFNCLSYSDVPYQIKSEEFIVYSNDKGSVLNLDYVGTPGTHGDGEIQVSVVSQIPKGPIPQLQKPIVLVDNKVPEPEVEKSFLQKYGWYFAPILILILMGGGGGE